MSLYSVLVMFDLLQVSVICISEIFLNVSIFLDAENMCLEKIIFSSPEPKAHG